MLVGHVSQKKLGMDDTVWLGKQRIKPSDQDGSVRD